ncbi:hypothetical protein [Thetidibacter halocola]|uniref:ApeA N-terminal domain-containing protein n=1 Tax=Thetidibacter halocola TaxID=2827239 RepID=A0A8J8B768_9RHOB|nr:hypothetical protein [Thetidibacter halocola]MBS0123225.1 hypothetical protein [Thetidibacter halocola]
MLTVDDFAIPEVRKAKINLPNWEIRRGQHTLTPASMSFRYHDDFSPRLHCEFSDFHALDIFNDVFDGAIKFSTNELTEEFLCFKARLSLGSNGQAEFGPMREPFLYGEVSSYSQARCVVVNGPNTFFEKPGLSWESSAGRFVYKAFDQARDYFENKKAYAYDRIPTGVLSLTPVTEGEDDKALWKHFHRAAKVLSFTTGGGVAVGHVEATNGDDVAFRMLGFSRCDGFFQPNNWFDLEVVNGFSSFAGAFHRYLEDEPSTRPLTYSLDFYRASNAARSTSLELAIVASYSSLEILVHFILREKAGWSKDLLNKNAFSDKLRAAAAFIHLAVDPLEHASNTQAKLKSFSDKDGYAALAECRNSIVHSDKSFRLTGIELEETWRMSQWLVEIFSFFVVGYRGLMADRRRMSGWRGEGTGLVPLR